MVLLTRESQLSFLSTSWLDKKLIIASSSLIWRSSSKRRFLNKLKQKALSELSSPIFSIWLSLAPIICFSILRSLLYIDSENVSNFLSNAEVISSFNICAGVPTMVSSIVNAFPSSGIAYCIYVIQLRVTQLRFWYNNRVLPVLNNSVRVLPVKQNSSYHIFLDSIFYNLIGRFFTITIIFT